MATRHPTLSHDALTVLMDDHSRIKRLFDEFRKLHLAGTLETAADTAGKFASVLDRKRELIDKACVELTLHLYVEEIIFHPEARKVLNDDHLMNEIEVQHTALRDLIDEIDEGDAEDPMICAMFMVLGQYADHNAKEEEREIFPLVRASSLNLDALGERMMTRREWLEREIGVHGPETEVPAAVMAAARSSAQRSWWDRIADFARG